MLDASLLDWLGQTVEHYYVVSVRLTLSNWFKNTWLTLANYDFLTNVTNITVYDSAEFFSCTTDTSVSVF